jgi:hypothetical protein
VNEGQFLFGCQAGCDQGKAPEFRIDQAVNDAEAVGALGMSFTGIMVKVAVVSDKRGG